MRGPKDNVWVLAMLAFSLIMNVMGARAQVVHAVSVDSDMGPVGQAYVFSGQILDISDSFITDRDIELNSFGMFNIRDSVQLQLSGPVTNVHGSGLGIVKRGPGTLAFSGPNTYLGNTVLLEGSLQVSGDQALGHSLGALEMNRDTTLIYEAGARLFNYVQFTDLDQDPWTGDTLALQSAPGEPATVTWIVTDGQAGQHGALNGTAVLRKQGKGLLSLHGESYGADGLMQVEEGAVAVHGWYAGAVQVWDQAQLRGSGYVGPVTTLDGGVLAPDDGPSTLTVNGDLRMSAGAALHVNVDPDGRSGLVAVRGEATLDGHVQAWASHGIWELSTSYTIVHADGGLNETRFASVGVDLPFLTPSLSYGTHAVTLTMQRNDTPLIDEAETPQDEEIAAVIDESAVIETPTPGSEDVPPVVPEQPGESDTAQVEANDAEVTTPATARDNQILHDQVAAMTGEQARDAFQQLSGAWASSLRAGLVEDSRFVRQAVLHRMAGRSGLTSSALPSGFWSQAFHSMADRAGQDRNGSQERAVNGLVIGADRRVTQNLSVGGFLGMQDSRHWQTDGQAHGRLRSTYAGLALSAQWGAIQAQLGAAHGWHSIRSDRSIAVAGLRDGLNSRYKARSTQVFAGLTMTDLPVSPYAQFAWVQTRTDGFAEQGGAAALAVEGRRSSTVFGTLGVRAQQAVQGPLGGVRLTAQAGWRGAWGDTAQTSIQTFRDSVRQTPFQSEGLSIARNAWELKLGAQAQLKRDVSLGLRYAGQYARGRQDHGVRLVLAWQFD